MNSLSGFALAAYSKTDAATEGAMKYFIYGSVTGALMIFGLTYWIGITGSTLLSALNNSTLQTLPVIFGLVALVVGISYAASIFPFHFWTPDTFEGAPVSIAAYLSVIPKVGAIYALAQVIREIPTELVNWPWLLAILSVLSMTFGNVVALWQQNVVRLLAYSTVAQAGYFLLGIVAMQQSNLAIHSLVIFGVAYAVMNTGVFAIVLANGKKLEDLKGIGKTHPWASVAMTIFLFSLVGIPPLAGFAGKFLLFGAAIDSQFTWLAIAAILNSVISLAVYLRIVVPMYYQKVSATGSTYSQLISFVWIFCLFFTLLVGLGVQVFL
jgi:NADH-quinone oxidoreductase subunit N